MDDTTKLKCDVILEEYRRLNEEILKRIDFYDKNISYQFVLLGIVASAITAILAKDPAKALAHSIVIVQYILLVSPIVFYFLGFYNSINNMYTFKIAHYITTHIQPRMAELLNTDSILGYEQYIQRDVFQHTRKSKRILREIVLQWTLVIPVLLTVAFFAVKYSADNASLDKTESVFLFINLGLMITAFFINAAQFKLMKSVQKSN